MKSQNRSNKIEKSIESVIDSNRDNHRRGCSRFHLHSGYQSQTRPHGADGLC